MLYISRVLCEYKIYAIKKNKILTKVVGIAGPAEALA
jgi:hypothetical protein